jgi:hypothetical protein
MTEMNEKPPKRPLRFRKLSRAQDVRRAALKITNAILAGDVEPRQANAAIYALHLVQRSLEVELLEQRLDALEARAEVAQPRLRSVS